MRCFPRYAAALGAVLCLALYAVPGTMRQSHAADAAAKSPSTTAASPAAPAGAPASQSAAAAANAAAAKHAKRVECLKQARTKKLVGADRDSYVKSCVAAP
ncbi:MAG TPA: hypothetical protein VHZ53_06195 [Steroidobacteraceae bacterium]|jgi:hypothetical protein|nr:hypothetical protein [Steroidobacteraceae bacterium]